MLLHGSWGCIALQAAVVLPEGCCNIKAVAVVHIALYMYSALLHICMCIGTSTTPVAASSTTIAGHLCKHTYEVVLLFVAWQMCITIHMPVSEYSSSCPLYTNCKLAIRHTPALALPQCYHLQYGIDMGSANTGAAWLCVLRVHCTAVTWCKLALASHPR
jgi:hypothetical protein